MALDSDFAFEGFRLIKKKPGLLGAWILAIILMMIVIIALIGLTMWPVLNQISTLKSGVKDNPEVVTHLLTMIWPIIALSLPLGLLISAIMRCAVYRALSQDKPKSWAYIEFGGDEVRQMIVLFLYGLTVFGLILLLMLVCGLCIGASVAVGAYLIEPVRNLVIALVSIITVCAGLFFLFAYMVRMTLCGVQTYVEKTINLFGSLKLTKNNGWNLFVGYIIITVIAIIISLFTAVFRLFGFSYGINGFMTNPQDMAKTISEGHFSFDTTTFAPMAIFLSLYIIASLIAQVVIYIAYYAAPMAAYRSLKQAKSTASETMLGH